ncbi:hypothetical protein [Raoultella ornithinolytica]|uniref:hypothetical protein n=1 Tax=Raoultella ornithinolytica TaxID=54291 RepID=UPI0007CBD71F|nr:hypothetical protein [Raoultella ornithinolytica]SBL88108.1 Uncharacterised protein [Raoultella ornithinolytica]VTM91448.1 Uncharacterised protein [Raoultella ornithinolytica]
MESNLKQFLTNALKIIPGYDFLSEMYIFIKHPEIYDGTHEYAPLVNSGANLFKSILIVGSLITAFSFLSIKAAPIASFKLIFNQLYWYILLLIQPIKFGIFFWLCMSTVTRFKRKVWHSVYFFQVIQTYAVINIIAFFLFCIAINRIFLTGYFNKPFGNIDLIIGFILAALAFILTYRLLIAPSFHYLSIYYKRPVSAVILLLSLSISYYLSSQIRLVDGKEIINKKEFCELSYHLKTNPLHINEINKNLFLNACINIFSRY